ncbi:hypothetical protein ACHAXR_013026 [Thalassiosira sp. AJA248-18]
MVLCGGKELCRLSSTLLLICMLAFNTCRLSSLWDEQHNQLVNNQTWLQTTSLAPEENTNNGNTKYLRNDSATAAALPKHATKTAQSSIAAPRMDDHPICSDNTAEAIRAEGEHTHIEAADVDISMFPQCGRRLGVQITSLSSKSPGVMQSFAGRLPLQQQQADRLMSPKNTATTARLHTMSHEHKAPAYDDILGCDDEKQTPSGTAVVVLESFHGEKQRNLWHSLSNHHGIWLLLQVLSISPSDVTAILPTKFGTPFEYPPRFVSDVLWPMHIHTNNVSVSSTQRNCFEKTHHINQSHVNVVQKIVFMETNSSPYWCLRFIQEKYQCSDESPYMRMHRQFHYEARAAAMSVLGLEQNKKSIIGNAGRQPPKVVCYMSRRLRPERKRHFSRSFEKFMDKKLDDWATAGHGDASIEFRRLEFNENVPFAAQVQRSSECSILFGTHGAGLGHMIWMESGSHIVEIGNHMVCETYYKSMSVWYGHEYTCFSELDGHKITHDKNQVYHSLNVTLLLNVLDDAIDSFQHRDNLSD